MQISLYSDNYKIINSGQTFLFGANADFRIKIVSDNNFEIPIIIKFENDNREQRIEQKVSENIIWLNCFNFDDLGTGLTKPISIARIEGKEIYLMFWSYIEGNAKIRSVKYTIYEGAYEGEYVDGK